jgi:L-ascorbate metabolism protein UlaG (beta-lactamase superfamily)
MSTIRLTHIGGPTVLVGIGDWSLLVDPTFDPAGRRYRFGWGTSSRKVEDPAVPLADLPHIDAVLITHDQHADNLDDAGRALLPNADVVLTTESGARRLGGNARGLDDWDTTMLDKPGRPRIEVIATPCRHGPPLTRPIVGDVVGFALRWDGQQHGVLWFSGDTVLYGGVREVANRLQVGTAILHLGGVKFPVTGPLRFTMTAADGVELIKLIKPHTAAPVHYEGWSHFQEERAVMQRAFDAAPVEVRERIRWLRLGEAVELDA